MKPPHNKRDKMQGFSEENSCILSKKEQHMENRYTKEFLCYADLADAAMQHGTLIPPVQAIYPDCTMEDAYCLQFHNMERRLADGWKLAGYKVGVIAESAQCSMDTLQPVFGTLYDRMILRSGTKISLSNLNNPLLEVEVALVVKRPVREPIFTVKDAISYIQEGCIAFEVVSGRLNSTTPNATALIADGTAARFAVLGEQKLSGETLADLQRGEVKLLLNGEIIESGNLSIIFGTPLRSFVWISNMLLAHGRILQEGNIVMTGSATRAVPIRNCGQYCGTNEKLGTVEAQFI